MVNLREVFNTLLSGDAINLLDPIFDNGPFADLSHFFC